MKGPKKFKVLGQPFKVRYAKTLHMKKFGALNGRTRPDRGRVDLATKHLGEHKRAATYLHELLHAVITVGSVVREHDTSEEDLVSSLTPILLHTMRENPRVVAYLMKEGS